MAWDRKREVRTLTGRPWRRLRELILQRDQYLCQPCKRKGKPTLATQVDHIVPLAKNGTDKPDNLQSICEPCHERKTLIDSGQKPKATIGEDGWPL